MESPGEFLRRERELRGVTLETISSELKLSPKTIKALEDNNEAELPHSAYVKGFIKSYCHWLGLDDNDAILRYESYLRERSEIEDSKKSKGPGKTRDARKDAHPTSKTGLQMTMVFAVLGLVVLIGYVVIFGGSRPDMVTTSPDVVAEKDIAQAAPAEGAVEDILADEAALPEPSAPIVVLPVAAGSESSVNKMEEPSSIPAVNPEASASAAEVVTDSSSEDLSAVNKDLRLEIYARELTWVQVTLDGEPPYDITLRQGERVSLKAAKVFF